MSTNLFPFLLNSINRPLPYGVAIVCFLLGALPLASAQTPAKDGQSGAPEKKHSTEAASGIKDTLSPRAKIDAFFTLLSADHVEQAYEEFAKGSIISDRKEDMANLKKRTQLALDTYGKIRYYEVINESSVGNALKRYTCLSLNEEFPLRWRFYFYDSAKGWKLVDLRVDDGLIELFDEVAGAAPAKRIAPAK